MSAESDAKAVADFLGRAARLPAELDRVTVDAAQRGLARVKANASGRPGPRRVTGDYTRSMNVTVSTSAGGVSAEIATNAAQSFRLEYGFNGRDSLGRNYCVDMATQALTKRGWTSGDQLCEGDEVLTLNPESWLSEWQPVQQLWRYENAPVTVIEGRTASICATAEHRWLVERYYPRKKTWIREWRTTETMPANARIPIAAKNADLPSIKTVDDDIVELAAWFWTEGSYGWAKHHSDRARPITLQISQSRTVYPANVERIERLLTRLFGPGGRFTDGAHWRVNTNRANGVNYYSLDRVACWLLERHVRMPNKMLEPAFLLALTQDQLDLLIEVSVLADGSVDVNGVTKLGQADRERIESWEMACILAGHGIATRTKNQAHTRDYTTTLLRTPYSHAFGSALRTDRDFCSIEHRTEPEVWCPTTANGTWLAKRNGTVYFTGNSQPPLPHWRPMWEWLEGVYFASVDSTAAVVLGG